jgi:hypothetical protein
MNVTLHSYENGERIVQVTVFCTDRGTANERYSVC